MQLILEKLSSKQSKKLSKGFGRMFKRVNHLSGKFAWLEHFVYLSPWISDVAATAFAANLFSSNNSPLEIVFILESLVPPCYHLVHNIQVK